MDVYSVGDIATALGVSVSTVHNWTDNPVFKAYLSTLALRTDDHETAKERKYTQDDLYVLNTISKNKTRTNTWEDVAALLESGERDTDLPASAMLVLPASSSETFYTLARAQERIQNLEQQVSDLKRELEKARDNSERGDLQREIGKLLFMLEMNNINPKTGKPD